MFIPYDDVALFPFPMVISFPPFSPQYTISSTLITNFDKSGMTYTFWVCNLLCYICYNYYYAL